MFYLSLFHFYLDIGQRKSARRQNQHQLTDLVLFLLLHRIGSLLIARKHDLYSSLMKMILAARTQLLLVHAPRPKNRYKQTFRIWGLILDLIQPYRLGVLPKI